MKSSPRSQNSHTLPVPVLVFAPDDRTRQIRSAVPAAFVRAGEPRRDWQLVRQTLGSVALLFALLALMVRLPGSRRSPAAPPVRSETRLMIPDTASFFSTRTARGTLLLRRAFAPRHASRASFAMVVPAVPMPADAGCPPLFP